MKEFDDPQITVTREEYDQLVECRRIVNHLWEIYGPYNFPKELEEPFMALGEREHRFPRSVNSRIRDLEDFDDSE